MKKTLEARTWALALSAVLTFAGLAAAEVVQSTQPDAGLALVVDSGSTRVESADGRMQAVVVPKGAVLTAIAPRGDAWVTAGVWRRDGRSRLLLITNESGIVRRWASPRQVAAPILAFPTLLADGGDRLSLAWMEGDGARRLRLRASSWEGDRWSPPTTISRIAPGSQTALRGVMLADGSALLVWSRFDGHDDEIYWSSNAAGDWSAPQPVAPDNAVPDVIPAVALAGGGAVAAWSRYDGNDYRLVVARFRDGVWSAPRQIGGPGSLYPSFTVRGDTPQLLYKETAASAWSIVDLDDSGEPRRQATFVTDDAERPLVDLIDDVEAAVRWPLSGRERRQAWSPLP